MTAALPDGSTCPLGDNTPGTRMHSRTKALGTPPIPCGIALVA